MTATTAKRLSGSAEHPDPGLRATITAEWAKLRTAKAPRRNLVLGTVLGIAMSLLLSGLIASTFDEWSAGDKASFDPIVYPLSGSLLMAVFFVAASVGAVAPEYGTGMIRLTLTATPKRWRVLAAKAIVVTAAVSVASVVTVAGMILPSQAIFAAADMPSAGIGDGDLLRALVLLVVTGPVFPVLAVAAAFLLRAAAASVTSVLALIFLPSMFGGVLPDWWQRNALSLLPGTASDSVSLGHLDDSPMYLHPVAAALVVAAWIAGAMIAAGLVLGRRDA